MVLEAINSVMLHLISTHVAGTHIWRTQRSTPQTPNCNRPQLPAAEQQSSETNAGASAACTDQLGACAVYKATGMCPMGFKGLSISPYWCPKSCGKCGEGGTFWGGNADDVLVGAVGDNEGKEGGCGLVCLSYNDIGPQGRASTIVRSVRALRLPLAYVCPLSIHWKGVGPAHTSKTSSSTAA